MDRFRRSGYDFHQNAALIAKDFLFNRADIDKLIGRRQEGGGMLGVPIVRNKAPWLR